MEPFRDFLEARFEEARQELTMKEVDELTSIMAETRAHLAVLARKAGGKPWKTRGKSVGRDGLRGRRKCALVR